MRIKKIYNKYSKMPPVLKASIWFFICSFLQKGISTLTTPIFTRLLNTSEYGIFNLYISWSDFLGIIITLGLSSSVYQKKIVQIDGKEEQDILTSSFQGLATITTLITLAIYLIFREQLNVVFGLPTNLVLPIFASVLASTSFGFWSLRKRVDYEYKSLVLLTLVVSIIKPVLGITGILLFPDNKVPARIYTIVLVDVLAYLLIYIKQFKDGKVIFHREYWRYAIIFVLPLIPHYISQRILSQSDKIMINTLIGSSETGIYSLAHSIGWMMNLFVTSLDSTLAPWTYSKLRDKEFGAIKKYSTIPIVAMSGACLIFIVLTPELVRFFASPAYYDAIWLVPPLVVSTFFIFIYTLYIYIEYYYEETKLIMLATGAVAALNVLLNYVFIKLIGYQAAAYTSLVCYAGYAFVHYLVQKRICVKKIGTDVYDNRAFLIIGITLVLLSIVMMLLYNNYVIRYALLFILLIILFWKRDYFINYIKSIKRK